MVGAGRGAYLEVLVAGHRACAWRLGLGLLLASCTDPGSESGSNGAGGGAGHVSGPAPDGAPGGGSSASSAGVGAGAGPGSGTAGAATGAAGAAAAPGAIPLWEAHIRGDVYRKMVVEVDVTRGFAPESGVMEEVFSTLTNLLDKPDGIEVVFDQELEPVGASHAWTFAELQALASDHMNLGVAEGVDRIHVMWLDGHDESDGDSGSVLGLAWGHRHIVMYKQTLAAGCDQLLSAVANQLCRAAERAVMTHEVGHVIGLVDNGLPMITDHRDPDHGHHSGDPESVMYWQHERDGVFDVLLTRLQGSGDPSLGFDANSLADIAAVRDR